MLFVILNKAMKKEVMFNYSPQDFIIFHDGVMSWTGYFRLK